MSGAFADLPFASLRGEAELAVYIDLKSPYAYLAIDPTRAMAAALGVEIDWRPFTLDIPSYLGSAKLDEKGAVEKSERTPQQWTGVKYSYADARRYANLTGKTVRGTIKIWDSSQAGIAMLWAKRQGSARLERFLDEVYPPFWRRDLDIDDVGAIERVLGRSEIEVDGFREYLAGEGREEHDRLNEAAFDAGVFGVPTYLVGNEMWFGREHLPRVAWLLGGSVGAPPDVAKSVLRPVTLRAAIDEARLSVLLDLRHPHAYLALQPAADLARDLGIEVNWLPVTVATLKAPSEALPDDDRGVRHRRHRARAIAREIETYANARGLVMKEIYRDGDTRAAHLGWLWMRDRSPAALESFLFEIFRVYWAGKLDPSDLGAVAQVVDAAGGDAAAFALWAEDEGLAAEAALAEELRTLGIAGVPGYIVEGEFFLGRQHLPMIRWILEGRAGPGPI